MTEQNLSDKFAGDFSPENFIQPMPDFQPNFS